jgi:hypothetical protein
MLDLPKLVVVILLIVAAWYVRRWLRTPPRRGTGMPRPPPQGRTRPPPQRAIEAEDLVACSVCGAYVAASAPPCGKPGCPRPR